MAQNESANTVAATSRKLRFALLFTLSVFVVEIVGGIWAGSLALVSDALHVLFDASALGLSLFALSLSTRPPTERRTYGLHRMEVFAAVVNGVTLLIASGIILFEAYERFGRLGQVEVRAGGMTIVAVIGLIANAIVLLKLGGHVHGHRHEECEGHDHEHDGAPDAAHRPRDLNLHSAVLHVASDLLASVGVVTGGVLIWTLGQGWAIVDPLLASAIGVLILVGAARVLYQAGHILLEGVPHGLKLDQVAQAITALPTVKDVHHLHVWSICSNLIVLSAHVVVSEADLTKHQEIMRQINRVLRESYHITDTTLQMETLSQAGDQLVHTLEHPLERPGSPEHEH